MLKPNFKGFEQGFTLVELMVTIALVAILLAIAVPSFSTLIESSRERATRDTLVSSIYAAKQQALSKRINVYLCPTTNGTSCNAALVWGSDWLVYEDIDDNNNFSNGDIIVSYVDSKTTQIRSTTGQIRFSPTGHSDANTFLVCSNTDNTIVYQIVLSRMGRVRIFGAGGNC